MGTNLRRGKSSANTTRDDATQGDEERVSRSREGSIADSYRNECARREHYRKSIRRQASQDALNVPQSVATRGRMLITNERNIRTERSRAAVFGG